MMGVAACHPLVASAPDDVALARQARLLRVEDTRRDEPLFLDSLLDGSDASQRAAATLTVGRIGARAHLPRLRALAVDADTAVSTNALFSLGLLKDTASAALGANALRAMPSVAVEAAWLLGELGERGRAGLTAALRDSSISSTTRGAMLLAAARLRPVPAEVIAPWVMSADSAVAWRAAYSLARGRSAAGVRTLLGAVDRAAPVREQVARGLAKAAAGDSLADTARAALRRLVTDSSARVRVNAIRALASYGRTTRAPVLAALHDRDAAVRLAAAQSLDLVLDSSVVAWRDAFDSDTAFVMRRTIAAAAARHDVLLDGVREWSTSREWQHRAASLELEARGAPTAAVARLRRWRDDPDGRVRAAGAGALAAWADSAAVRVIVRTELRAALRDQDVGVRTAALGALASGATQDDLSAALDSYQLSSTDRDNDARLAFWALVDSVLARAAAGLSPPLMTRLEALPRPADPLERIAAARIARFAAWRDGTSAPRAFAWYLQRARDVRSTPRPVAVIETERGTIELALFASDAPLTVHNFVTLAQRHYFDGQRFHRVVPNFVVQGGDPRGDGNGGPGYAIRDEMNRRRYLRGTLGMALSGPDTGGSQFFVTHSPQPHLDGGYTVFGQLIAGGDVLDRIVQGDRIVRVTVR